MRLRPLGVYAGRCLPEPCPILPSPQAAHAPERFVTRDELARRGGDDALDEGGLGVGVVLAVVSVFRGELSLQAPVCAGEFVTTGSITNAMDVSQGDTVVAEFATLGLVSVRFT